MQGALWPMHLKPMSIWPSKSETLQTLLQKFLWEVGRSKVGLAPDHPVFCRQPCHKLACFFSEKNPKCCFDSHFLTNVSYTPKFARIFRYLRSQYVHIKLELGINKILKVTENATNWLVSSQKGTQSVALTATS